MCFLCLWNSRQDSSHYLVKVWLPRQRLQIGRHNIQHQSLVSSKKVFLLHLHIKLGFTKNFVKAMNWDGNGFKVFKDFFVVDKSDVKLKAGLFLCPEIRKLMLNEEFDPFELDVWNVLKSVVSNFLEIAVYAAIVDCMLKAYG